MKRVFLWLMTLCISFCALPVAVAQEGVFPDEEEVRQEAAEEALRRTIRERGEKLVKLLRSVKDAASAKKHAAAIRELLFWNPSPEQMEYVDEELLAVEYLTTFEQIAAELDRLAKAGFYGEPSLQDLLLYFEDAQNEMAE